MFKRVLIIGAALFLALPGVVLPSHAAPPLPRPRPILPGLEIAGEWQVVFNWRKDRCTTQDTIPDLPARAWRDSGGMINLTIAHTPTYRMTGKDFDSLKMDCTPILRSAYDSDPASFANHEWIASTYTEDGKTVHALAHNEFQGNGELGDVCPSGEYIQCWYNTITLMTSVDGGKTFHHALPPPGHLVANFPQKYVPDGGVFGAFSPSNIIKKDGNYYAFFKLQTYVIESQRACLMRTDDLSDPASWRFWNGKAFAGTFADPYRKMDIFQSAHTCAAIGPDTIAQMFEGITWNTYLDKYVLVGTTSDPTKTPNRFGFYYALSDDLIHWDRRKILLEVPLPWTVARPADTNYLYPTLIDPDSQTRNFETTGKTAYLFFTRNNDGHTSLDRDLIRVPVHFVGGAAH